MNKEFVKLRLSDIRPYPNNPRINDNAVKYVVQSIKDCENLDPIEVDEDNIILSGHTRLKALEQLGYDETECVRYTGLSEDQKKKYRILANKTGEFAEWDLDILSEELDSLLDFDAEFYDFDISLDDEEEPQEIVEDEPPEPPAEPKAKLGDLWQLGSHRLICGDSTDVTVIDRLMDGVKSDMVFTDPPYGMKKESEGVLNDNLNYDDLLDFNRKWIPLTFGALKDNGSWYCWGIDEPLMDIYSNILKPMARENKITFRNLITWDKGNGQGQLSEDFRMYPIADEKCLFVMCGQQHLSETQDKWTGEFDWLLDYLTEECAKVGLKKGRAYEEFMGSTNKSQHHLSKSHFGLMQEGDYKKLQNYAREKGVDAFKREYEDIKREYYANRAYFDNTHDNQNNVWHFDRAGKDEREHTGGHATPKPIALCSRAIKSSSREGEIVLDVFGGSGSTLIACEQLNRKCYMVELDPKYTSVIVNRWLNFTGRKDEIFCIRDGQKLTYDEVFS